MSSLLLSLLRSNKNHNKNTQRIRIIILILLCFIFLYMTIALFIYHNVSQRNVQNENNILISLNHNNNKTSIQSQSSQILLLRSNQQQQQQQILQHDDNKITDKIFQFQYNTFPLHVGNDTIIIQHPGLFIIEELTLEQHTNILPNDLSQNITVPRFFDESYGYIYNNYNNNTKMIKKTIRNYLGNGQLLKPEIVSTIGSYCTSPITGIQYETIYVSIASYRDPECTNTVIDLYNRAQYPERIRVSIIDQRLSILNDPICGKPMIPCTVNASQTLCKYQYLIDYYEIDARLAVGPVFARHISSRYYRGEYYTMQIDSHIRFIQYWDTNIINQWRNATNEMAILTTYLSDVKDSIDNITYTNIHKDGRPIMCQSDYENDGEYKHLRHGQQPEGIPYIKNEPTIQPYWAAGFSFGRGHFTIQVPYDLYLPMIFMGEEISIGIRGFTYGYDYYTPERSICFHMYERKNIPLFWENSNIYNSLDIPSMRRLNNIIGMGISNSNIWYQKDIQQYGLGYVRTKEKFFHTFGIHVHNQTIEHHLCRFVGKPMMKIFKPALRTNKMGINYNIIDYEFIDTWHDE